MDPAWREHFEALQRFNRWEDAQLRGLKESYSDALAWMSEAWEMANRTDPTWLSAAARDEHARDLIRLQQALAKARLSP